MTGIILAALLEPLHLRRGLVPKTEAPAAGTSLCAPYTHSYVAGRHKTKRESASCFSLSASLDVKGLTALAEAFKSVIKRDTEGSRGCSGGFSFSAPFAIKLGLSGADSANLLCVAANSITPNMLVLCELAA